MAEATSRQVSGLGGQAQPLAREPFVHGEVVVSFWEYLPEIEPTDLVTLAGFLRQLHTVPVPQEFQLVPVRPFV
ncbi:MAG TPA: hypothetical protein VFQ48_02900, partial [Pseudonocardiaceae bacterium]|nr:hypothetical protein [Pseudonocardiaceae bacterium]